MKKELKLLFGLVLLLCPLSCDGGTRYANPSPSKWHEGGTLMTSNLGEWRTAPYENRLATSADMVTSMLQHDGKPWKSLEELRAKAIQLEACISETASAHELASLSTTEISASCHLLMGW